MLNVKYQGIWTASSWEEDFLKSQKFTPFCPLLGPNRCQPLDFRKHESPFPKDTSHQIWFKWVKWFWRWSRLKEKFTDGRRTGHDHYSSLSELKMQRHQTDIKIVICKDWLLTFSSIDGYVVRSYKSVQIVFKVHSRLKLKILTVNPYNFIKIPNLFYAKLLL